MICGAWPRQSKIVAYTIRVIIMLLFISSFIPQAVYSYNFWGNFNEIVHRVINQIQDDWKIFSKIPEIKKIMNHHATDAYNYTLFYMFLGSSYVGFVFIAPVMDIISPLNYTREMTPLYKTNYGVDSEKYFFSIYAHGFIITTIDVICIWTSDTFIIMMVQHCCTLFSIVGILLQQLNSKNCNYNENHERKIITQAIIVHKYAIEFAEFIEKSVTKLYGFVFLLTMIFMSITGFYVVLIMEENGNEGMRMVAFTIGQAIHLFFSTLPSQSLINSSENVFYSVYNCQWNELSIKSQNSLCIMLIRSSKSTGLTASKFYPINLENFGNIIKTSISYFTVLKSMQ
ncbi:hypothetical protein HCN44_001065 [Aphidius gifuensis]|uniref:Odorant receptor n=1 Tax=Aphidius gifuensis TaxID=684658 RepID=A0A834XN06_APHGI|nr:hypothetical protein HCN44_001065 [Aphidius gifuensis]